MMRELPVENPTLVESPARYVVHIREGSYFHHFWNQEFVRGNIEQVKVANPLYQHRHFQTFALLATALSVLTTLLLIAGLVSLLKFPLLALLFYPAVFLSVALPFHIVKRYTERVNRRLAARFQREGQIVEGELVHALGSPEGNMGRGNDTFVVSMGYKFDSLTGATLSRYFREPRPDLDGLPRILTPKNRIKSVNSLRSKCTPCLSAPTLRDPRPSLPFTSVTSVHQPLATDHSPLTTAVRSPDV